MHLNTPVKYILLLLCSFVLTTKAWAQDFSYVYIQGDKETPFYVKFEGEMLPRYGKNYIIIPMLAPGPINIEVLFQQNKYPAQKYVIQVAENGFRGFLLNKNSGSFSLYDIYRNYYIHPGNKAIDDKSPNSDPANDFVTTNTSLSTPQPQKTTSTTTVSSSTQPQSNSPKFIADIQINSASGTATTNNKNVVAQTYQPTTTTATDVQDEDGTDNRTVTTTTKPNNDNVIINSDCPEAVNNGDFEDIYKKALDKNEKTRLKYLLSQMDKCYNTDQARSLTLILSNDPEKYTFLKRVYPRITDQSAFPPLENLLSTNEWKSYFRLILPE